MDQYPTKLYLLFVSFLYLLMKQGGEGRSSDFPETVGQTATQIGENITTVSPSTTENPQLACVAYSNTTCQKCVAQPQCYWCISLEECVYYSGTLPALRECGISDIRWSVCWLNLEVLLISVVVVVSLLLILMSVCCCRYCQQRRRRQIELEEEQLIHEREERLVAQAERRTERRVRNDEIRRKYGLLKDENSQEQI